MPALGTGKPLPMVEPGIKYSQGGPLYGQKLGGIAERQQLSEAAGEAASATAAAASVGPGPLNSLINRTNRAREGFRRQTVLQSQVDAEKEKLALAREQEVRQWAQMALEGKFKGMEMQRQQQALDAQIAQNKQENAFRKEDIGLRREGQAFDQGVKTSELALRGASQALDEKRLASDQFGKFVEAGNDRARLALEERRVEAQENYYKSKALDKGRTSGEIKAGIDGYLARIPNGDFYDENGELKAEGKIAAGIIQRAVSDNPNATPSQLDIIIRKEYERYKKGPKTETPEPFSPNQDPNEFDSNEDFL